MKIKSLPKTMTEAQAMKIALGGGNVFGKLLFTRKDITLKLMYLESKEIIFDMTFLDAPLMRFIHRNNPRKPIQQKFRTLAEGTRGGASFLPQPLVTVDVEVEEDAVQVSDFSDEKLVHNASYLCRRMVRRQIGKLATTEVAEINTIYRPYYIAFYGAVEIGEKVRYLPIAADGNSVERTF